MFSLKKCLKLEFVPIIRKKYGQFSENPQFGNKVWFSGPKTTLDRTDLAAIYWENALKFKHCVLFKPNIGFTQNYEFIEKLSKVLNCASLLSVWLMQLVFHIDLDKINTIRPKSAVSNHDAHFYFSPGTREKQLPTWDTNQTGLTSSHVAWKPIFKRSMTLKEVGAGVYILPRHRTVSIQRHFQLRFVFHLF